MNVEKTIDRSFEKILTIRITKKLLLTIKVLAEILETRKGFEQVARNLLDKSA